MSPFSPPAGVRTTRTRQGPPVLALTGEFDHATLGRPALALTELLGEAADVLVLDLTDVTFGSAGMVTMLLAARAHATERGTDFRVVTGRNRIVERLLDLTASRPALDTYPDLATALDAMSSARFVELAERMWTSAA
ncbi:STAS domain-containing protein [Amycolatopsis plumensis]|uniref:STAS domain-containing protein n=1 Tax=Amycolatopsis plumensis TaxID=236508 RepID=A0ABV5UGK6_9PSEU